MHTYQFDNFEEVSAWILGSVKTFDLGENSRGQAIAEAVAEGIARRSYDVQGSPSDPDWPENKPPYKKRKERLYGTGKTNYRTGQMLSRESILGKVTIDPKTVEIHYGTGKPPTDGMNGYIEEADKQITDIEKAFIAASNDRAFFELDDEIKNRTSEIVSDALADHLRSR
jgi:hypothetical protein